MTGFDHIMSLTVKNRNVSFYKYVCCINVHMPVCMCHIYIKHMCRGWCMLMWRVWGGAHACAQVERPYEDIRGLFLLFFLPYSIEIRSQWIQNQPLQLNWWQQSPEVLLSLPSQWWGYQEHVAVPGLLCGCWFKLRPSCLGGKDSDSLSHLPTPETCCLWKNCKHFPCSWEFASPPGTPQNIWVKWTQWIYLYVKTQAENMIKREFKKNLNVRIYKM